MLFSDESKFVFRYGGKRMVWRRVDEHHDARCMTATVKTAQPSVMVWGALVVGGVSQLHRIE